MVIGASDHNLAGLERLAQRIKHRFGEFGELVEKQDTTMGEGNLTRASPRAAADKCGHRGRMMRVAKRTCLDQTAGRKLAGD